MLCIALTGGIATGKSTVAKLLAARGAVVVDADVAARTVVEPGQPALAEIGQVFGPEVIADDGSLNRERLAGLIFSDAAKRKQLEDITHPLIRTLMAQQTSQALATDAPLVVADIPLLFEGERRDEFDGVLFVDANNDVQTQRLMARDGINAEEAAQRIATQLPNQQKRQLATWAIDNSGDIADTERAVDSWWAQVVSAS